MPIKGRNGQQVGCALHGDQALDGKPDPYCLNVSGLEFKV